MASKSVLELAVGTGKWDSGLKKAKAALDRFTEANGGLSKVLQTDADKMQKFVSMMGKMDSTAKTAKGQMNDYKSTIEQLTMQYNRMSEAQKKTIGQDYLKSIDQIKQKYQAVNEEVKAINRSLQNTPDISTKGGSLFSGMGDKLGGAMQVFAGNLMTKATMEVANLGAEMVGMVQQGVELAKAGEGIRNAFARLGRGDILDGLRQATHGTVTDLELMKAAVKFNDFRLPLNELGTMLAFAQQKAKDTGQSVDYMVDSIVTGLGRKSLMILDNLGLSASEIRERMKETGDMTTAVGAIIREQMAKAGDYMETAADRAAQANVNLQNKLEEVGRKFAPIEEASTQLWTSMKIAILDVVSGPLARLLNMLTDAGRLKNTMNDMAGGDSNTETDKQIGFLQKTSARNRRKRYDKQIAIYQAEEAKEWRLYNQKKAEYNAKGGYAAGYGTDMYEDHRKKALSWQMFRLNYQQRAQGLLTSNKPLPPVKPDPVIPTKTGNGGNTTVKELTEEQKLQQQINDLVQQGMTMDEQGRAAQRVKIAALQDQLNAYKDIENELRGIEKKEKAPEMATGVSGLNQRAISTYQSMLQESMKGMEYGSTDLTQTLANSIDVTTLSNLLKTTLDQGLDITKMKFENGSPVIESLWETILSGKNIDDKVWEDLGNIFSEQLKAKGGKGIKINTATGAVSEEQQQAQVDYLQQMQKLNSGLSSINSGLQQIGIKLPDGMQKMLTVMQGVTSVIQGVQTVISVFSTSTQSANTAAVMANTGTITALTAAVVANTAALSVNTTANFIPFATGGIVHAAGGTVVPGNSFSGDNIPALLNSGEVVLTRAQAGVIADALGEGNGNQGGGVPMLPYVSGDKIYLGINNFLKPAGKGELVTTSYLRQKGLI